MTDKENSLEAFEVGMEFAKEIEMSVPVMEEVVLVEMEDPIVDEVEMDAFDGALDSLYAKLVGLGLTEAEVALLGVQAPSVRKAKKDVRTKKRRKKAPTTARANSAA